MKTYKPTTPSLRNLVLINKSFLWKSNSLKALLSNNNYNTGGRNNTGRITVFQRGGGIYHKYRVLDFFRKIHNIPCVIVRNEYDPNRSSFITLLYYSNGLFSYILTPQFLRSNLFIMSGVFKDITFYSHIGNCTYIQYLPLGSLIHNIEVFPGSGGKLVRTAGNSAIILKKFKNNTVLIQLRSGWKKLIPFYCKVTLGSISNPEHRYVKYGKAGRLRWLGIRPNVRGYAMNPVDHPLGGRTHGGKLLVTPWGKITKGKSTRRKLKPIILNIS